MIRARPSLFCCVFTVTLGLLLSAAVAQTSTWVAPSGVTPLDWADSGNWDNGVPNSASAVAVFTASGSGAHIKDSAITVDSVRFGDGISPPPAGLNYPLITIGMVYSDDSAYARGSLTISGAGVFSNFGHNSPTNIPAQIKVRNGTLRFEHDAVAKVNLLAITASSMYAPSGTIEFADNSSAQGVIELDGGRPGGKLVFRDQACLQGGRILFTHHSLGVSSVSFRDRSKVVNGQINSVGLAGYNMVSVADNADVSGLIILAPAGVISFDISQAYGPVSIRSIDGPVDIFLGQNTLEFPNIPNHWTMSLTGRISGAGGLTFSSSSTASGVTLTNPLNEYTGVTRITSPSSGVILAGGRINNVILSNGGSLSIQSSGIVGGDLVAENGSVTLPLGNGVPSSLQVLGNYDQRAPSLLQLGDLSAPGVVIGGSTSLAGALELPAYPDPARLGTHRYTLLTAAAITGHFDTVTGLNGTAMLSRRLDYGSTDVAVLSEQMPFASNAGNSPAASALGAQVDATLANATGGYRNLIIGLNELQTSAQVATALAALSPDRYAILPAHAFAAIAARLLSLDQRFADARNHPSRGEELFFVGGQRRLEWDARPGLSEAHSTDDGGLAGGIWHRDRFTVGAFVATETAKLTLDDTGSRADAHGVTPGALIQFAADHFFINTTAAVSRTSYDLRRRIVYPGLDETAVAHTTGTSTDCALTTGYVIRTGHWTLTPQGGLLFSRWRADDFTETQADSASLGIAAWTSRSLRSRLGVDALFATPGTRWSTQFSVRWLHEFEDARPIPTRLVNAPDQAYNVPGRPAIRDVVQASVEMDGRFSDRFMLFARLGGATGKDFKVTSDLSAGFSWRF